MSRRSQLRLIFHGALFMVISMTVEMPGLLIAFHHALNDPVRQYLRQAHVIVVATGIWMIATGAALPLLELTEKWIATLVWSLVVSGYTFLISLAVLFIGFRYDPPDPAKNQWDQTMAIPFPLGWINIGLIGLSGLTSLIPGVLIVWGAWKAMRHSPVDQIH